MFNKQLGALLAELIELYPEEKDLKVFNEKFKLITKINGMKVVEGFLMFVYPHKQQIMDEDEKFFLSNAHGIVNDASKKYKDMVPITQAMNLKHLWEHRMDADTKACMWKYFKVLVILCERVVIEKSKK